MGGRKGIEKWCYGNECASIFVYCYIRQHTIRCNMDAAGHRDGGLYSVMVVCYKNGNQALIAKANVQY